jgi:hypothetical protein
LYTPLTTLVVNGPFITPQLRSWFAGTFVPGWPHVPGLFV